MANRHQHRVAQIRLIDPNVPSPPGEILTIKEALLRLAEETDPGLAEECAAVGIELVDDAMVESFLDDAGVSKADRARVRILVPHH